MSSAVKSPISSPSRTDSTEASPKTSPTRNQSTATSAAIAAALDATRAHQTLLPGLATLFFESGGASIANKASSVEEDGHPLLPTMESVINAALKSINDFPPYVTMNVRDSAPQLTLEDPMPKLDEYTSQHGFDFSKTIRRMVVRGGMRGYRMARASHGVGSGCYYYEVIVLGKKGGMKRPRDESSAKAQDSAHLRVGWSTRLGDLQAPVGYDKHSYAIRDIMGSRIHNSRREDKWGGLGFGPGDVMGFAICFGTKVPDGSLDPSCGSKEATKAVQSNNICVYKNGVLMSGKIAFEDVSCDTYFPAISCYLDGAAQMNFGPCFVYPPTELPNNGQTPKPISEICPPPPTDDEAEEQIISSSKEGRKIFLSKRTDEVIVAAFKQLVRTEANIRRDAYLRNLMMHRREIKALREERELSVADLSDADGG